MLEAVRQFFRDLSLEPHQQRRFEADDYRLAAVALLIHIAHADGATDQAEQQKLREIIAGRFGLEPAAAATLIELGEAGDREAIDFYQFTSILNRALDEDGRREITGLMWDMALADGTVHEFEENAIWRISELLGIGTRERVLARQEAEQRAKAQSAP